jgi:hypothetical protein
MTDSITVLECSRGYSTTKTHRKIDDKIKTIHFDSGKYFTSKVYPINGIHELSYVLKVFEPIHIVLAIRGAPQPGFDISRPHQRTKNGPVNYLTPQHGRQYVMIDIDKLGLPVGMKLSSQTVNRVIDYVVGQLPAELQNVTFHWQLSSSAGVGDASKVSIHLWFWLDRPIRDCDLGRWGKAVNVARGFNLIDTRLFNDVQPHFIAAPSFENMDDPIPARSGLIEKELDVAALVLPPETISRDCRDGLLTKPASVQRSSGQGFENILSTIGDHLGGDGFHMPIIRAIASYVATAGGDNVDVEWLYKTVSNAVLVADASRHESGYIDHMASREHIMPAIEGALEKYGHQINRVARLVKGVPAHFSSKPVSLLEAQGRLSRYLDNAF